MRRILIATIALILPVTGTLAQNKNTIFYDSLGQLTTWENHWAQVVTGRYKSIYNRKENKKTLARMSENEFHDEIEKTERKITNKNKLGKDFPSFDLVDIDGNRIVSDELIGKVLVLNFWFIGCAPCEMERPTLNRLVKTYSGNTDVIFISFAKNNTEDLLSFLKTNPIAYRIVPTDKDYIESNFEINGYPANIVVDKAGKYFFDSGATGIGILEILQNHINNALKL